MTNAPRLTIGIPTCNRPGMLPRALRSALAQTIPVRVVIADDGDPGPTGRILASAEFRRHRRRIRHLETGAASAWPNWRAAAGACDTDYFAWLQDDDVIRDAYAARVVAALDAFPDCDLWMSRLACGFDAGDGRTLGMPYRGNCALVPMDMLAGNPARWMGGDILAASSYLTSWALCPAQAYRDGDRFRAALAEMPDDCDMFIERLFPAVLARGKPLVADPIVAGYWMQHARMLSQAQNADEAGRIAQATRFFAALDVIFDRVLAAGVEWRQLLARWLLWIPPDMTAGWLKNLDGLPAAVDRGRHLDTVADFVKSLIPGYSPPESP